MRLASLFGPDAIAHAPRAPRYETEGDVRVVIGLQALTRAVAEIERLPDAARTPAVAASYDEVTQMVNPIAESRIGRAAHPRHDVEDDRSQRQRAAGSWRRPRTRRRSWARSSPSGRRRLVARRRAPDAAPAGRRGDRRRRDHRPPARARAAAHLGDAVRCRAQPGAERPFFGIYLPAHPDNRQASQRSLIGPDDKFVPGGMVELDTGNARYLIRFTQTLERQAGWAWALFTAVRKLTP